MKTFVMMSRIVSQCEDLIDVTNKLQARTRNARGWLEEVYKKCPTVKFVAHYALLGPYDFMDIYEAPDEKTAARVSMLSRRMGAVEVESWMAIPSAEISDIMNACD